MNYEKQPQEQSPESDTSLQIARVERLLENLERFERTGKDNERLQKLKATIDRLTQSQPIPLSEENPPQQAVGIRTGLSETDNNRQVEAITPLELFKLKLRSAINSFIEVAERKAGAEIGTIFQAGGPYHSGNFGPASEYYFTGDKRVLPNRDLGKPKVMFDTLSKDEILTEAEELMPKVKQQIEVLLKEYDNWKRDVYRPAVAVRDFNTDAEFRIMTNKVVQGLKQIEQNL